MTTKIETGKGNNDVPTLKRRIELRKTKIYYAKLYDNGSEAVYLFPMFDKVVYVRVRYREKNGQNIFVWTLDPILEKVGLSLAEVNGDGEA